MSLFTDCHTVDVWVTADADVNNLVVLADYRNLLNEEEIVAMNVFAFEHLRKQYLITRALLRQTLSFYEPSVHPSEWCFGKGEYGKPFITSHAFEMPLHFNLSHTEGRVVLAISREHSVGVDIEYVKRGIDADEISKSFFAPNEIDYLQMLNRSERELKFFEIWTLKESYIKAVGKGLNIPLQDFHFSFSAFGKITIAFSENLIDMPHLWVFHQYQLEDNYCLAVATKLANPSHKPSCVVHTILQRNLELLTFSH
tara:strand:+ start:11992 stop:12756 length:765 start_codon:yes stop_codon:yes gene_type:complete